MEVHLSPELQAKVERAAAENKSGAEEYVKQLVEHYVDHDAWFRQQVTRSLELLDRGEFLTHEEVGARIDQMFLKPVERGPSLVLEKGMWVHLGQLPRELDWEQLIDEGR